DDEFLQVHEVLRIQWISFVVREGAVQLEKQWTDIERQLFKNRRYGMPAHAGCTSACLPGTTLRMQWRSLPSTSVHDAVTWNKAFLSLVTALPLGPVTSLSMSTVVVGITRLWISTAVTSLGSMVATGSSTESELMT